MLEKIYSIEKQNNNCSNKNNDFLKNINKSDSLKSFFNKLNKFLLSKKIRFDDISTEEKKDDENQNIACTNFITYNLLNILYEKSKILNSKILNVQNDKIQKKKICKYKNFGLDSITSLEDWKKNKIREKIKKLEITKNFSLLIKSKDYCNKNYKLKNTKTIKNLHLKQLDYENLQKKINVLDINNNNIRMKKNEKKINFFSSDIKINKNSLFLSKNINNIKNINILNTSNFVKNLDEKNYMKLNIEPLILNNSKNSIKWQKLISNKILLSISQKNNQAEIHLKPESLGSIHIILNIKNDIVKLKFISKYKEVRIFLDSSMSFLRHSLKNSGIKLKEFNILSSLKKLKNKNYKNLFYNNIYSSDEFKQKNNTYKKNLDLINYKLIDMYV